MIMEKYSKAVSETCSQFKQSEAHPMEKYIGRHVTYEWRTREVVGYTTWCDGLCSLIVGGLSGRRMDGIRTVRRHIQRVRKLLVYQYRQFNRLIDYD